MDPNQLVSIKFKNRNASNISDKRIAESYCKSAKYDVDLVTADGKHVSAHRFVLAMFSKYLAKQLADAGIDGVIMIPLTDFTYDVVKKVVELLYFREINIPQNIKPKMMKIIIFLKIDNIYDLDAEIIKQDRPMTQSIASQGIPNTSANRTSVQKQPAIPAKRTERSASVMVSSIQQTGQNIVEHRHSVNLLPQMTLTKVEPKPKLQPPKNPSLNVHLPHPAISKQSIGQKQINAIPCQSLNGATVRKSFPSSSRQPAMASTSLHTVTSNLMRPPLVTNVLKSVKPNNVVQQQTQHHEMQPIPKLVKLNDDVEHVQQNATKIDSSGVVDDNNNQTDDNMDIDMTIGEKPVNNATTILKSPKVDFISDMIIETENPNIVSHTVEIDATFHENDRNIEK